MLLQYMEGTGKEGIAVINTNTKDATKAFQFNLTKTTLSPFLFEPMNLAMYTIYMKQGMHNPVSYS